MYNFPSAGTSTAPTSLFVNQLPGFVSTYNLTSVGIFVGDTSTKASEHSSTRVDQKRALRRSDVGLRFVGNQSLFKDLGSESLHNS